MNSSLRIRDNLKNLCRFCEQPTKVSSTQFDKLLKNKQICKQFSEYFGIKVGRKMQKTKPLHTLKPLILQLINEDELPSLICNKCNTMLPKYLAFHKKCLNSYHHLKNIKFQVKQEKAEEVDEPIKIEASCFVDIEKESDDIDKPGLHLPVQKKVTEPIKPKEKPLKRSACPRKKKQCNICGAIVQRLEGERVNTI
jgi:hypothetical protein